MEISNSYDLLPRLHQMVRELTMTFSEIPEQRKQVLGQLTGFLREKTKSGEKINLNFICTHNSRRSHIAQLWAHAAACNYSIPEVHAFSGGMEATAFNPRAVEAMRNAGFDIIKISQGDNPHYAARVSHEGPALELFSKKYNHAVNPLNDFTAIMTCSHADENCPLIPGASKRIAITYDDPKDFDGTPLEVDKYRERVTEIGRDILYAFSQARSDSDKRYQS